METNRNGSTRRKILWLLPLLALFAVPIVAGQLGAPHAGPGPARDGVAVYPVIDHSLVNWGALPLAPNPAPLAVAAYDS